jgi:hypothetical protein
LYWLDFSPGSTGWKYYLVFAVCACSNALTIYLFFPETKGRTLEEMDAYFAAFVPSSFPSSSSIAFSL